MQAFGMGGLQMSMPLQNPMALPCIGHGVSVLHVVVHTSIIEPMKSWHMPLWHCDPDVHGS